MMARSDYLRGTILRRFKYKRRPTAYADRRLQATTDSLHGNRFGMYHRNDRDIRAERM